MTTNMKPVRLNTCAIFRFIACVICFLTFAPTLQSVMAQQRRVTSTPPPEGKNFRLASAKGSVKVPFELFEDGILLQFRINNSRPIWFFFDTGASVNIINESLAKKSGLTGSGVTSVEGSGGSTSGFVVNDVSISLPGVEAYHQTLTAILLDQLSAYEGREMGGIIGNPFIMNFVVEIDYARKVLTFYDRKVYNLAGEPDTIPLEARDGQPFVKVELSMNGRDTISDLFMIDTGSDRIFHVNRPFAEAHRLMAALPGAGTVETVGAGTGGQTRFTEVRVSSLRLGGYSITRPVISISQDAEGIGASDNAGIVGAELLRRFTLVLDYQSKRMRLKPNASFNEPFEIDMSGLNLMSKPDDFRVIQVERVRAQSPAAEAGLRQGDVLVTINRRPAGELGLDKLSKMFRQSGRTYLLTIRRGAQVITARLKMRRAV